MSASKVITLLLIGIVAGVLIAPAKGSKTRKKLTKLYNDVSDSVQDVVDVFCDKDAEEGITTGNVATQ